MPHIALAGRMGAGKSTLASFLETQHGYRRLSLAAPIKDQTKKAVEILRSSFLVDPDSTINERELNQELARVLKEHLPSVLTGILLEKARGLLPRQWAVVDDVRTNDELRVFREKGFVTVLITCQEAERILRVATRNKEDLSAMQHPIENETFDLTLIDHVFENTSGADYAGFLNGILGMGEGTA